MKEQLVDVTKLIFPIAIQNLILENGGTPKLEAAINELIKNKQDKPFEKFMLTFLKCDLKIGRLKHQDIGQMQMYVNYYDRKVKLEDENPTIGILLCKNKNDAVVEMTLPEDNNQIFASKYLTVLPSKEDLKKLMESE